MKKPTNSCSVCVFLTCRVVLGGVIGANTVRFVVYRADLKLYFGPPGLQAVYKILMSCLTELARAGIIAGDDSLIDYRTLELAGCVITPMAACT